MGPSVIARVEIDIAAVKGAAIKTGGVQVVGMAGVVGLPGGGFFEISLRVIAKDAAVHRGAVLLVAHGAKVDIAAVENRAEITPSRKIIGVAGVVGVKGVEVGARHPLRDQRLYCLGAADIAVDPGGDGKVLLDVQIGGGQGLLLRVCFKAKF